MMTLVPIAYLIILITAAYLVRGNKIVMFSVIFLGILGIALFLFMLKQAITTGM